MKFIGYWLLLFGICILVRLPYFLSASFFFDIDEATIGIMAQDVLDGGKTPYYFYLQNYGLSTIEVLTTSLFILVFGSTIWALKLSALFLYALGCTFILAILLNKKSSRLTLILSVIFLASFPSWYMWGSLMRGGYLTAFVCLSVIFYITQVYKPTVIRSILVGFLFYIGYESHVLLIIIITPLIAYWIGISKTALKQWFLFGVFSIIPLLTGRYFFTNPYYGSTSLKIDLTHILDQFQILSKGILNAYTGFYAYYVEINIPHYWYLLSIVSIVVIVFLLGHFFVRTEKKEKALLLLLLAGGCASAAISLISESYGHRYLLGFFTSILLVLFIVRARINTKTFQFIWVFLVVLFVIGSSTGSKLKKHYYHVGANEMQDLDNLYQHVKKQGIKGLYALDNTFVWDYLYGDEIPATIFLGIDRSPEFADKVALLRQKGSKIGLFGYIGVQQHYFYSNDSLIGQPLTKNYFLVENFSDTLADRIKQEMIGN